MDITGGMASDIYDSMAGLDEGILSFCLPILVYMENPNESNTVIVVTNDSTPSSIQAEGVSNASAVVCFMSEQYQSSENCQLELKFAKQSGVGIIPVVRTFT